MSASTYNISLERNADYSVTLILKDSQGVPIDVTDAYVCGQIKQDYYFPPIEEFIIDKITPESGVVKLRLEAAQTVRLHPGELKYDILVRYSDWTYQKLLKGTVSVDPNITTIV